MEGSASLSQGALSQLVNGQQPQFPIFLQCLETKIQQPKDGKAPTKMRFRLVLNDGSNSTAVVVSPQLCDSLEKNPDSTRRGSVIKTSDIISQEVQQGRKILIIMNFETVGFVDGVIGNPQPLEVSRPMAPGGEASGAPPMQAGPNMGAAGGPMGMNSNLYNPNMGPGQFSGPPGGGQYAGPGPQYGAPAPQFGGHAPQGNQYGGSAGPGPMYGGPPAGMGSSAPGPSYGGTSRPMYGGPPQQQQGPSHGGPPGQQGGFGGTQGGPGFGSRPPLGGGGVGGPGGPGSFLGQAPPAQYNMQGGGPVARNEAPARIMTIRSLNPYSGRWAIKARCTSKTDMRRWNGVKGEGKLFSFDLLDSDGGEIRVTGFNDQADKYFDRIEVGGIYMLSKASLQHKKPQFNNTAHDFEIQLGRDSQIERVDEDDDTRRIPRVQFNFTPIEQLEHRDTNSIVDVLGVVEQVHDAAVITRKTGEETRKRSVVIRDATNRSIEITLWGNFVDMPGNQLDQGFKSGARLLLGVKAARLGEFNGKTLSTLNSSTVIIDPPCPESDHLRQWLDAGGAQAPVQALSNAGMGGGAGRSDRYTLLSSIRDENLGKDAKPDWITVLATITFIRNENGVMYPGCPNNFNGRMCQKKLADMGGGEYSCERCQKSTHEPCWRYVFSIQVGDHSSSQWLSVFGDAGDAVFGRTALQYRECEMADDKFYDKHSQFDFICKPMAFRLKVAEETWNDEQRVKVSVFKMEPVSCVKDGWRTLDLISKLEQGIPVLQAKGPEAPGGTQAGPHKFNAMQSGPPGGYSGGPPQGGNMGPGGGWGTNPMVTPPRGGPPGGYGGGGYGQPGPGPAYGGHAPQGQYQQGPPPTQYGAPGSNYGGGPQMGGGGGGVPYGGGGYGGGPQGGPPQGSYGRQPSAGGYMGGGPGPAGPGGYPGGPGMGPGMGQGQGGDYAPQGGPPGMTQGGPPQGFNAGGGGHMYGGGPPQGGGGFQPAPQQQQQQQNMGAPMW